MIGELFDPKADFSIRETCKPHWSQSGAVVFITFRTRDSIPAEVIGRWERERCDWLIRSGVMPHDAIQWSEYVDGLAPEAREAFSEQFYLQQERYLDDCRGDCVLRSPKMSKIVHDALMHFDGDRYRMGDFIVMPNHVHLLASFSSGDSMGKQCRSWTHYTAVQINRLSGKKGAFWQTDPFDHLVRSPEQYDYLRQYIADNPKKARLSEGEYLHRRSAS